MPRSRDKLPFFDANIDSCCIDYNTVCSNCQRSLIGNCNTCFCNSCNVMRRYQKLFIFIIYQYDVYRVQSINIPTSEAIANLKERLLMYGYNQWLAEG
ncbi:MAG: hypothetical protein ACKOQS_10325 [Dolichospermum sp.]